MKWWTRRNVIEKCCGRGSPVGLYIVSPSFKGKALWKFASLLSIHEIWMWESKCRCTENNHITKNLLAASAVTILYSAFCYG